MWPFNRFGDRRRFPDLDVLVAADDWPKRYVNLLLMQLANAGGGELTIRESQPMPQPTIEASAEIPSFATVSNRLKVMANLDPILYREPKTGSIDLLISNEAFIVHARFDDRAGDRSLTIELKRRQAA